LDLLREARAPQGMEERVLAAVRMREAAAAASRPGSAWVWGGVAAAAAVVVAAALWHGTSGAGDAPRRGGGAHAVGRAPMVGGAGARALGEGSGRRDVVAVVPIVRGARRAAVQRAARVPDARVEEPRSYPAPPAPLTQQELALVAIARSGRLEDFAMLNEVERTKQNAAEEAEFQRFVQRSN
jgi:hypothetical protein